MWIEVRHEGDTSSGAAEHQMNPPARGEIVTEHHERYERWQRGDARERTMERRRGNRRQPAQMRINSLGQLKLKIDLKKLRVFLKGSRCFVLSKVSGCAVVTGFSMLKKSNDMDTDTS